MVYTGGVLEYEPYNEWLEGGGETIVQVNAWVITEFVVEAKQQGVDILVIPEYGVQSLEMHRMNATDLFTVMQFIPDPSLRNVPCSTAVDPPNVDAVRTLSCAALENEIYLVIDCAEASPCSADARNPYGNALDTSRECPDTGYIYYNTQVVFDRDGVVIARYRKKNLFLEWQFSPGTEPNEDAIFTTDFGVTFTLQICFDIAYFNPGVSNIVTYGIRDVVMSTAWTDMLPFHIAPAVQNSWSRGLGVNLLVAGYHLPEKGKMGSGIYRGASDLAYDYIYDTEIATKLLVSQVESVASVDVKLYDATRHQAGVSGKRPKTKKASGKMSQTNKASARKHQIIYDDLTNYTQVLLEKGESNDLLFAEACHMDGLCCQLSYYPTGSLIYSLLAYSGPVIKGFGAYSIYAQTCGILWCQTEDVNTCGHIDNGLPESDTFGAYSLTGVFSTDYVFGSVFDRNLAIIDNDQYDITAVGNEFTISMSGRTRDLMTAGFYARWYERDP